MIFSFKCVRCGAFSGLSLCARCTFTKRALLLLAVLASGCGLSAGSNTECDIDGLTFEADVTIDCAALSENVALARQMTGHIPKGYTVQVRNDLAWYGEDGKWISGHWESNPEIITVGRDGVSLAHEFLHDLEWRQGIRNTGEHPQWTEKGLYQISEDFKKKVEAF
jgi:hypothetical protein